MYWDGHCEFSDAQAVTASAASTNLYDARADGLGAGEPIQVHASVQTTFVGITSLSVALQSSDGTGFGTSTTHWTGPAIALASLAAGYRFNVPAVPSNGDRYWRLYYTVVGGAGTAGKIDAGLVHTKQTNGYETTKQLYDAL